MTATISIEDNETTFPELIDRLQKSVDYLQTFSAEQIDGSAENDVDLPLGDGKLMTLKGWPFLAFFVLPNVYFHITTTYDILRHNGVVLGKLDYLGKPST